MKSKSVRFANSGGLEVNEVLLAQATLALAGSKSALSNHVALGGMSLACVKKAHVCVVRR